MAEPCLFEGSGSRAWAGGLGRALARECYSGGHYELSSSPHSPLKILSGDSTLPTEKEPHHKVLRVYEQASCLVTLIELESLKMRLSHVQIKRLPKMESALP